jgi:glyoxalase family protein
MEVSLEVPAGSLDYWESRLQKYGTMLHSIEQRFADRVLPLVDPHGLRLALVEPARLARTAFTPWDESPVPGERQVRGLHGARLWEQRGEPTAAFLTGILGFERLANEGVWTRYGFADASGVVDVQETPDARPGSWGVGSVHHLAWRVDDAAHQERVRADVEGAGAHPTPVIDRFWFRSVYFREPGGVLFEIATDGPGFAVDEEPDHLGEALVLPPFLEAHRPAIESVLPVLRAPSPQPVSQE